MKRSPLKPGTARGFNSTLPPGKPPKRTARLRARRVSKRFAKLRSAGYREAIRARVCIVGMRGLHHADWPCAGNTECAHVRSRGAGGADVGNCIPLCNRHHAEQHSIGIRSFQDKYDLDLYDIAADLAARYAERYAAEGAT